jgi:tetratricopeptide (TPR) repeat protein
MLYNVNPATQCSTAARDMHDVRTGLAYCDEALSDPLMNHRAALLVNRGILKFAVNDTQGALADFNAGVAANAGLSDAYVNRAALLVSLKRYDEARADLGKAIQLGTPNMHVVYYTRAVIEDDAHDYAAAYRDYKQALALKPGYAAASRELVRFKVTPATAANTR